MKNKEWESEGEINLTPLLDVILNLLFFFILSTQIKESKEFLDIDLPESSQIKTSTIEKDFLTISIDKDNNIFIDGNKTDLNALSKILAEKKKSMNIKRVIIKGDAKTDNQTIVSTLDECAKANLTAISLEAVPK